MDKKALRRAIGAQKRALSDAEIDARSAVLAEKLYASELYRRARSLYAYMSYNQEVRTRPIIRRAWADGKRVAVPKVTGENMAYIWIEDFDGMAENGYGIPEPRADGPVADDPTALVLTPGLAFDPEGHRVGYGGGYYDRFFGREPGHPRVALCYDFQLLPELAVEAHDVPVDRVLSDR